MTPLELRLRVQGAGCALMRDAEGRYMAVEKRPGSGDLRKLIEGKSELSVLDEYARLQAEARAQALHLHCSREKFLLREWVTMQLYGEGETLARVAKLIRLRSQDQSPELERLRRQIAEHC